MRKYQRTRFRAKAALRSNLDGLAANEGSFDFAALRSAAVLESGNRKVGIFDGRVEKDEKFSGSGDEGEFGRFACCNEACMEGLKFWMMARSTQGAEVKDAAYLWAAAMDITRAVKGAAVAVAWSKPCEAADARGGAVADFREEGKQSCGGDFADARGLEQAAGFGAQVVVGLNVACDKGFHFEDAFVESGDVLVQVAQEDLVAGHLAMLLFHTSEFAELVAAADQGGKKHLAGIGSRGGRRLKSRANGRQGSGIHGVCLGQEAKALGEFAHAGGMEHADGDGSGAQRADHGAFVAACGFANNMDGSTVLRHALAKRGMACWIVGKAEARAAEMASEAGFRDIKPEIDEWGCHGIGWILLKCWLLVC